MQHTINGPKITRPRSQDSWPRLHGRSMPQDSSVGQYACPLPVFEHFFDTSSVIKIVFPTAAPVSGQSHRFVGTQDGRTDCAAVPFD